MAKLSNKHLLAIAVLLSLVTAILLYQYLKGVSSGGKNAQQGVSVVVAKVDIGPKTKITAEMVKEETIPLEYLQPGAIQSLDKVVGIVAREMILNGEQIGERRLVREAKSVGFTGVIPRDKRAVTVAVNEVTGVAGLIKAGDYVDVVVAFDANAVGDNVSHVLLQDILVLAANRDTEISFSDNKETEKDPKEGVKAATVTLAVTADEAAKLTLASEKGKIHLALRPYLPLQGIMLTQTVTPRDLVGSYNPPAKKEQPAPAEPTPAPQPVYVDRPPVPPIPNKIQPVPERKGIQVIRGSKIENVSVH